MSAAHTPGPWHRNIKPATKYNTVWSGRNKHVLRMVVDGMSPEEVEANICLATAAPDLLEALTSLRDTLQRNGYATDLADAAIARATGGQQ